MAGRDCIGNAKTGSGKTIAFALPILQKLSVDPYGIFALVLTPTRYVHYDQVLFRTAYHKRQRASFPDIRAICCARRTIERSNSRRCWWDGHDGSIPGTWT